MKILVTPRSYGNPENSEARKLLESFADEIVVIKQSAPLEPYEVLKALDGADGYIAGLDNITAEVLEKAPESLRVISRWGIGVDRVDIECAKRKGIIITNTPGANSTAVCELAFGLMLTCARGISALNNEVHGRKWPKSSGVELFEKKLGIVGLGAIGKKLAIRAKAFGMDVKAFDPFLDEKFAEQNDILQCDIEEIVQTCDFISLHVPLTEKTCNIINANTISRMQDGAILINTARGGLVDEKAVADALRSGKLGGFGCDAFEQEPPIDSPLINIPNAVLLPHIGAHTEGAVKMMGIMAVKNLISVLKGEACPYKVC